MTARKRSYFAKANRGNEGAVLIHNLLTPKSKSDREYDDRINRVQYLLEKHGISDVSAQEILKRAHYDSVRIDQIEKKIVLPLAEERADPEYQARVAAEKTLKRRGRIYTCFLAVLAVALYYSIWRFGYSSN